LCAWDEREKWVEYGGGLRPAAPAGRDDIPRDRFGEERGACPALGAAVQSACAGIRPKAQGAYFATDAPVVQTWEVRGQDPSEVVATVDRAGYLAFYVTDHLSDRRHQHLLSSLTRAG
jgi:hypothetical protein